MNPDIVWDGLLRLPFNNQSISETIIIKKTPMTRSFFMLFI